MLSGLNAPVCAPTRPAGTLGATSRRLRQTLRGNPGAYRPRREGYSQSELSAEALDSGAGSSIAGVPVGVAGDRDAAVAEEISDSFNVHTRLKPRHRSGMPQSVQPHPVDAGHGCGGLG